MNTELKFHIIPSKSSNQKSIYITVIFGTRRIKQISSFYSKLVKIHDDLLHINIDLQTWKTKKHVRKTATIVKSPGNINFPFDDKDLRKILSDESKEILFQQKTKLSNAAFPDGSIVKNSNIYKTNINYKEWSRKLYLLAKDYSNEKISIKELIEFYLNFIIQEFNVKITDKTEVLSKSFKIKNI